METPTASLVYDVLDLMPTGHQRTSLIALLSLFLMADCCTPKDSKTKSESGLSRFLNIYGWPTRKVVVTIRLKIERFINAYYRTRRGRRPILHAIVDLTCLEKTGQYKGLEEFVRVYNGKRGVHVAMLYLCIGPWRLPWDFRVYRGEGTPTPTQLALTLLRHIPSSWQSLFKVRVMTDAGFGSNELIPDANAMGFEVLMRICNDRTLSDKRSVKTLKQRGERVYLKGLDTPVSLSWFWCKHEDKGTREKHFVVATEALSGSYIVRLGKLRWSIEACFKTLKHRFGWAKFGAGTKKGMYRWWIVCWLSFLLAHWQHLSSGEQTLDWQKAAQQARKALFPQEVFDGFLVDVEEMSEVAKTLGYEIVIQKLRILDNSNELPTAA